MSTNAEDLRELRRLFDRAMDLHGVERSDWLDTLPGAVRQQVQGLLDEVDTPTHQSGWRQAALPTGPGDLIGPYLVRCLVGRGGMGAVYEAVRNDDQYHKRVAIKVVQTGLDTPLAMARFRRERQILANLEHRNIATLLDGGVTTDGRPFLVMEFVEGAPITTWCDDHRLHLSARIGLLRQVCSAVHHAHRNLVIHRDLKPGNILVTEDGTVKLLDFGIATLIAEAPTDETLPVTRGESRAFTPEYASPEQLRGTPLSTASDVYSLGVVAYELLTGHRPHRPSDRSLGALERAVLESPSPRPSNDIHANAAQLRGERDSGRLQRQLRGDLDDILLTALAVEPEQRYQSVEALGEDLRRHLAGLPIAAHRDWTAYRVNKFVRRHLGTVAASTLGVLALIGGIITTTAQAKRARTEQRATQEVNSFLKVILSSVSTTTGGRDVPVSELLDSAAVRLKSELANNPQVRAPLEGVIGGSYQSLGLFGPAEEHLTEAAALRKSVDGESSDEYIAALNNLGLLILAKGETDRADTVFQKVLAIQRHLHPSPDTMTALLLGNLGSAANARGDAVASQKFHQEALDILQRKADPQSDMVATGMNNLAVAYGNQNHWEVAESLHRGAIKILEAHHAPPSRIVADAMNALATALDIEGKQVAAESAYVTTLSWRKTLLGTKHPDYTYTLFNYSAFLYDLKRYPEAAAHSREILALRGTTLPESHPSIATALQTLGRCLDKLGDHPGAEQKLRESLALRIRYLGPKSWLVGSSYGMLGEHYTVVGAFPEAERALLEADRVIRAGLGESHPNTLLNVKRLVALYEAWHRPGEAAAQRVRLSATP